jgi:hypothetical protein
VNDRTDRINALLEDFKPGGRCDLNEFYRLLDELTRGGLPGQSMGDGIRSGGRPMPKLDPFDQILARTRREAYVTVFLIERYRKSRNLQGVERELSKFHNLVQSVTAVYEPKPDPESIPCANVACLPEPDPAMPDRTKFGFLTEKDLEEGRRKGECQRCRTHRTRHGLAWPNKLRQSDLDPVESSGVA